MVILTANAASSQYSIQNNKNKIHNIFAHHQSSYSPSFLTSAPAFTSACTARASPLSAAACSALSPLRIKRHAVRLSTAPQTHHLSFAAARLAPASITNCKRARVKPTTPHHCSARMSLPAGRPGPSRRLLRRISAAHHRPPPSTHRASPSTPCTAGFS